MRSQRPNHRSHLRNNVIFFLVLQNRLNTPVICYGGEGESGERRGKGFSPAVDLGCFEGCCVKAGAKVNAGAAPDLKGRNED